VFAERIRVQELCQILTHHWGSFSVTAAVIMSLMLLGSAMVTSTLINPDELALGGDAANRALAYVAHGQSGIGIGPILYGKRNQTLGNERVNEDSEQHAPEMNQGAPSGNGRDSRSGFSLRLRSHIMAGLPRRQTQPLASYF
jgi:hypothetical protein